MDNASVARIELLLRSICFDIKQKGREILSDFDITPPQFNALQFLVNEGEMTISELSSRLYLAPSTITDLIDRMEKNLLVIRERGSKDRRIVKIQVQDKGHSLINEVISRRCSYLQTLLKDMSLEDKNKFISLLEAITTLSI
jgi:DNA-binding MarR family transcriptional regulator